MAGIFSDVSTDIQKLRQLKAEIENVKKALKGIDINVNIDIAKGMEAQLQSLMKQYDALVKKVSEAEGKIMISTKRIKDASEKIIKAQEQLSKATVVKSQDGIDASGSMVDKKETENIRSQAKAYEELKSEIDDVLGTRAENIHRLMEEQNAINLIQKEIKQLTKYQADNSTLSNTQQKRLEQLNNSLLTHKTALSEVRQTLMNNAKLDNAATTSMNGLSQSLSRMRIAYRELTEEERNSPFGKALLTSIQQSDAKIKELDATIGNHQRNVGNYISGWNGLNMSVQQIVRELPSATMGLNMFFLAISNNLPILTDEIKRAKAANDELKKSGETGIPVWKQLVSSLFSWQTAMMVGITLLSMYGKDIAEWVKGLFNAKDGIDYLRKSQEDLSATTVAARKEAVSETAKLNVLRTAIEDTTLSTDARRAALKKIRDEYPGYFKDFKDEEILAKKASSAYRTLTADILAAAKARAYERRIEMLAVNNIDLERAITADTNFINKNRKRYEKSLDESRVNLGTSTAGVMVTNVSGKAFREEFEQRTEKLKNNTEALKANEKQMESYEKKVLGLYKNTSRYESNKTSDRKNKQENNISQQQTNITELEHKLAQERIKQQIEIENQVTQSKIDAMDDGFEKEKAQMELNHKKELQEIGRQRQEYVDSVVQMEKEAFDAKEKLKASKNKNYHTKTFDRSSVNVDTSVFDLMSKNVRDKQQKEISDFYKKSLSEYQDYISKYNATREKFSKERERYQQAGASDAQLKELNYQEEEALKAIDNEFASREKSFNSWADGVINLSLDKLRELLNQAYQELMNMEIKNPNDQNLAKARAKVNTLRKAIGDKEVEKEISPGKATNDWKELYKLLTDVSDSFKEIGDTVGGTFGEVISLAGGIASSALGAANGIKGIGMAMSALEKASGILTIISIAMQIISALGDFFKKQFAADYSGYDSLKAKYETLIELWDELIDKKMEYISIDYGTEAQKAADEAAQLVNIQISRQRQLLKELASSGSGAGSHSLGYRINDRLSSSDYERISSLVGQKITAEYQLWDLSSEQIEKLLTDEKLVSVLDTVNKDFVTYLQNIAQYGEQLDEIADKEKEALTGIGLDDFKSGYIDLLSDLDSQNEDFADNFEKYLQKAIFSSLIANKYKGEIENLYSQWASGTESGGKLTAEEAERLRQEQKELTEQMLADREQIMKDFGWESSSETAAQQASKAVSVQASQESIDEANGRLTAIQETGYKIEEANQQQTIAITELRGSISALTAKTSGLYNIADETRTILANSYLELQQIRENTGEIVKPIKQMQADIAEVKQNTSRL